MKRVILLFAIVLAATAAKAQISVGADVVSRYVWRGTAQSDAPAIQPTIEYSAGNFAVGAWGSYGLAPSVEGGESSTLKEADLYLSYGFDFGLSLGLSDYYYEGANWLEFGNDEGNHYYELNVGYEADALSLSFNYGLTEVEAMYIEAGYSFGNLDLFVGAADEWYTDSGNFEVVNVGIGTSKEIKLSETFSLPVFGQLIVNPNTEQFHMVVGISL